MIKRREFIAGLGGAAAWPLAARAQQGPMRRIAVLMAWEESDNEANARFSALVRGLSELGWTEGRNLRIDVRWTGSGIDSIEAFAKELVGLHPDAILATGTESTAAFQRETRTIPIVFTNVADPIGAGFVAGLPGPGGNITGFASMEAGKWLELLTEIAPGVKRVAIIFNPATSAGGGSYYLAAFEAAARSLKVEPIAAPVRNDAEIETAIASLGREPRGGLVLMPGNFTQVHRASIISLVARHKVPAVYLARYYVGDGGLLAYGPDFADMFHRAALYVDRILRGAKPADLPVQLPVKFEMAVNVKTANALSLTVPPSILLRADEVIE